MTEALLSFPPFLLDPRDKRLTCGKREVDLTPKDFALLRYLVAHPGRVVPHEELLQNVWSGVKVTQGVIKVCIRRIRQALDDAGETSQFIESSRGEGYQFIAPVTAIPLTADREERAEDSQPLPVVGREKELAQLQQWFEKALRGRRQIVFVTGEPGIGKTTLLRTFFKQIAASGAAAIGRGQCIDQYGAGEAYLPVLEALGRLCRAPGGTQLVQWMEQYAPTWLIQLPAVAPLVDLTALRSKLQDATRERMLREMAEGIEVLTANRPFVLMLEDLHWSDYSTLELIATLARRQEDAKLLVIGTYRPGEAQRTDHPLNRVISDLAARRLSERLSLSLLTEGQVTQYLQERFSPHVFPISFGQMLHRRTEGNPLFFTNLVEDWISRGVLVQDTQGWMLQGEVSTLEREIPESIRSLIAEQSHRLLPEEHWVLQAASLVGMEYSSAAVAAALGEEALETEEWCAGLANRQLFLHSDGASEWPDGTVAGHYRFLHALYQQVWTEQVNVLQRKHLHQRIGERKETAYGDRAKEIAVELAIHFEEGRDYQRAVQYRQHAAESAIQRCAHQEAETHLKKSLELLKLLPETPKRTQQELVLRTTLALTLQAIRGYGSAEVEQAYVGARSLVGKVRGRSQLFRMLFGLWQLHLVRAEYEIALELGQQLLSIAEDEQDKGLLVEAHGAIGVTVFHQGEIQTALSHLQQSTDLYDREQHRSHAAVYSQDPWVACRSYSGLALWLLGYPEQAVQRTSEALRYAQEIEHPFSQAFALHDVALVHQFHRNLLAAQQRAEELLTLAREQKFPFWELAAASLRGWILVEQGQGEAGAAILRRGADARLATGTVLRIPYYQARLAEACGKNKQPEEGLILIERALAAVAKTGERWWEAEIYRFKGELTLAQSRVQSPESRVRANQKTKGKSQKSEIPNPKSPIRNPQSQEEAEACFLKAIDIARQQQAKSLELRAAMSLNWLWQAQGKEDQAQQLLAEVYQWFTEGFETADLKDAKALLG